MKETHFTFKEVNILCVIFLVLFFLVYIPLSLISATVASLVYLYGFFLLPVLLLIFFKKKNLKTVLLIKKIPLNVIWKLVLLGGLCMIVLKGMGAFISALFKLFSLEMTVPFMTFDGGYIIIFFLFSISPAICEEVFFRAMLLGGYQNKMNFMSASIWSALIFSLIHFKPTGFLGTLFFGLITAYLIKVTESIWSTIIVHMVTNTLIITIGFFNIKYPVVNEMMTNTQMSYTMAFYLSVIFLATWCIQCLMQSIKRDYPKYALGDVLRLKNEKVSVRGVDVEQGLVVIEKGYSPEPETYEMTFEELKAFKHGGAYALWKGQNFQMPLGAILTVMPFLILFALFAYSMFN